jgi:hypothetical protein
MSRDGVEADTIQIAGIPSTELEPLPLEIVACHALVMPLNNAVGLID